MRFLLLELNIIIIIIIIIILIIIIIIIITIITIKTSLVRNQTAPSLPAYDNGIDLHKTTQPIHTISYTKLLQLHPHYTHTHLVIPVLPLNHLLTRVCKLITHKKCSFILLQCLHHLLNLCNIKNLITSLSVSFSPLLHYTTSPHHQ